MTIQYYTKNVYGETKIYLADYEDRKLWTAISGKLTITKRDMENLTELMGEGALKFERTFEPTGALR